jgi:purine nucleosidase
MKPLPIILDTDIGDDIDDALALAVALNSPEIELRGVTTVFRNAPRRALLAQHLLQVWGREAVPVVAGCSKPLLEPFERLSGGAQLGGQFEVLDPEAEWQSDDHAIDFLSQAIDVEAEPDPANLLTIVPIGPLTNIALALAREPGLIARSRIVLMGGQWSRDGAEWNIRCDPEAAAIVFHSGIAIDMVGLDVTLRCRLSQTHLDRIRDAGTPRAQLLWQLCGHWLHGGRPNGERPITLHDPLTLLTLFSDCVTFEDKCIEVGLCHAERGKTIVLDGAPNARVAVDVDAERAIDLFMERLLS